MLTVSVVTCAFTEDRWGDLTAAVESIGGQTRSPRELILVIDHNPELLTRARRAFPDVTVVPNSHARGASGARNTGAEMSRADIVAFLDDDARAAPTWLDELLPPFDNPLAAGVGGQALPVWSKNRPLWFPPEFDWVIGCSYVGLPGTLSIVRNPIGTNMSVRRDLMQTVGGFREGFGNVVIPERSQSRQSRLSTCEETEFCIRVVQAHPRMSWYYQPSATVYHQVPAERSTFHYFVERCWLEGQGKALLANLVGRSDALVAERQYMRQTVPRGIWHGIAGGLRRPRSGGLGRAAMLATGVGAVATSYLIHRFLPGRRTAPGNSDRGSS
jgi:glycosyltransferase involved in cell wall biosynthesis